MRINRRINDDDDEDDKDVVTRYNVRHVEHGESFKVRQVRARVIILSDKKSPVVGRRRENIDKLPRARDTKKTTRTEPTRSHSTLLRR